MPKKKIAEVLSKDFIKGLETGLRIAKSVAKKQGYEIFFPDVKNILIEKLKKKNATK